MISRILPYNSEVWGAFVKSDFKSWNTSARKPIYNSVNALTLHVELNSVNSPKSLI